MTTPSTPPHDDDRRPSALDHLDAIVARLGAGRPAIFLDFDGTLAPIVEHPEDARLAPAMRAVVAALAARHPLAVVSGRELADVRARVGLAGVHCAGSHGFQIEGPGGATLQHPQAQARLCALDAAEQALTRALAGLTGARIERKTFSLAVHYRQLADADLPRVQEVVRAVVAAEPGLRVQAGKKVYDFQPAVDWHKGRAVEWLLAAMADELGIGADDLAPLYVGDDVTDEDAFATLAGRGVTVAVLDMPRATQAGYRLRSVDEVQRLLAALLARLGPGGP